MNLYHTARLLVLTFLVVSTACQDHSVPTTVQFRIKRVTVKSILNQQSTIDTYNYDKQNRLESIDKVYSDRRKTSSFDETYKAVFYYDEQSRLKTIKYQPTTEPANVSSSKYEYEYDANGNAVTIKQTYTDNNPALGTTYKLIYNNSKFPTKITATDDQFKDGYIVEYRVMAE